MFSNGVGRRGQVGIEDVASDNAHDAQAGIHPLGVPGLAAGVGTQSVANPTGLWVNNQHVEEAAKPT